MPTNKKIGGHTSISHFYMLSAVEDLLVADIADNKDFQQGLLKSNRVVDFFSKEAHILVSWQQAKENEPEELGFFQVQEVPHESGAIRAFKITAKMSELYDSTLVLVEVENSAHVIEQVSAIYKVLKAFILATLKGKNLNIEANIEELFTEIGKLPPVLAPVADSEASSASDARDSQPAEVEEDTPKNVDEEDEKPEEASAEA